MARYRPVQAATALSRLITDPNDTSQVFLIIEALQGGAITRATKRLRSEPVGRRLLAEKPSLLEVLVDRERLRAMPEGSLAHAYLAFVEREGITADGLVAASEARQPLPDPDEEYVRCWLRDSHDLWHTVLGYHGDLVGEAAVLAFTWAQTLNVGVAIIASTAWFQLRRFAPADAHAPEVIRHGLVRGKRATWFIGQDWIALLGRPLAEVRARLGVADEVDYRVIRATSGQGIADAVQAEGHAAA